MPILELKNICVSSGEDESIEIISNINLFLEKKKIYVVTGPNGGGKTSLAKAVMGIYPLSGGRVIFDGEDITEKTITERAKMGIGYAFQAPPRMKGLSVRDVLSIAAGTGDDKTLFSLLADVGLCAQDYIDREMNASFSGGELKRVEIATLLARRLKVALFDEPEAGIDLWSFQRLTDTFKKLHETTDTVIIIISHQERILRLADEVILICGGRLADVTSPAKVLGEVDFFDEPGHYCKNCMAPGQGDKNAGQC